MIKGFIFDLDGTLVNTLPDLTLGVNHSLELNGFAARSEQEVESYLGNGSAFLIKKAIGQDVTEDIYRKVFDDYLSYYLEHVLVKSNAYKGMADTLKEFKLKGYKLFVLTNKPHEAAVRLVEGLFGDVFDMIIGNSDTVPTKPNLTGINIILNKFNLKPEEICYIGDSDVDMITADKANLKIKVACSYGYRSLVELQKYHPDYVIDCPSDLMKMKFFSK